MTPLKYSKYVWQADSLIKATKTVNGHWVNEDKVRFYSTQATRIITDTRKLEEGDIFLAIVGPNFDGHEFLEVAEQKGAIAAIVSQPNLDLRLPQLQVDDTRVAFGRLAAYRRQQHPDLKVIALTGSSGKTTVKEMLRCIFDVAEKASIAHPNITPKNDDSTLAHDLNRTLVTRGNLNNDFGVPMMLLELSDQHKYAVLELGANHLGEIAYTAQLVKPNVACILNIGTAHLGEFGGRDNIAKAKAEIYAALPNHGTAILPIADDYFQDLYDEAAQYAKTLIGFGKQQAELNHDGFDSVDNLNGVGNKALDIQVLASHIKASPTSSTFTITFNSCTPATSNHKSSSKTIGQAVHNKMTTVALELTLPMAGEHNVQNALAAAASAFALGIDPEIIVSGLSKTTSSKGRLGRQKLGNHTIIDDTYNANPNSVRAAADVLAAQTGYKLLILGDIGELGAQAIKEHTQLGKSIATKDIDVLLCVGEFANATIQGAKSANMSMAESFTDKKSLLNKIMTILNKKDSQAQKCTLLFKGSRSATMETLIESLTHS